MSPGTRALTHSWKSDVELALPVRTIVAHGVARPGAEFAESMQSSELVDRSTLRPPRLCGGGELFVTELCAPHSSQRVALRVDTGDGLSSNTIYPSY